MYLYYCSDIYYFYICLEIIDMKNKEIELNLQSNARYCTFNINKELIIYGILRDRASIWIYSKQTKNGKWTCKKIYEIRKDFKLISISKSRDVKLYFASNNSIYECNINNEKSIRIFYDEEENEVINIF
jgi:hypothetical protein